MNQQNTLHAALFAALAATAGTWAHADRPLTGDLKLPKTRVSLERCMLAALKAHGGKVAKVELKVEKGVPVYEFDIQSPDGSQWDVECDANSGKITELEEEVQSATDAKFAAKAKVGEEQARRTVLDKHPGEIVEVEYEVEPDGKVSYEFDVVGKDGKEREVELDATSGEIVEDNEEIYQIGHE
jgi:uncharacterized membrane protein YkoI